jgi:diguanylate cyclase (GGDEF)-like protein/PAS domain S-box-containing protein
MRWIKAARYVLTGPSDRPANEGEATTLPKRFSARMLVLACLALAFAAWQTPALALEAVSIGKDDKAVDLTASVEIGAEQSESLKASTAPDANGIVRRVEVRAKSPEGVAYWAVFALANTSNEQIDRLIVAPHYRMVGSGMFWPDLDSQRIFSITPSEGFSLERQEDREGDVFLVTLDPGTVVTMIAEMKTAKLPNLSIWDPDAYKDTVNSYTLYRGIVLGISGLLAVFLTILFVVKGSAMFPATAALAWGVLAYVCVDFGFWDRLIAGVSGAEPIWRAETEVFLAASLLIFLYAYLNLHRWSSLFSTIAAAWLLGLVFLFGVAILSPAIASGIARISFALSAIAGAVLIGWMAFARFDRAVMLIPTWILVLTWLVGSAFTVTGQISNDVIQPALAGGLVLVVMLLGFTVMQHAFAGGALAQGLVSDVERQALALTGSGYIVWDWDCSRDVIHTGPEAAQILGLHERSLNGAARNWSNLLHPNDRDRFHATLDAMREHGRGRISLVLRLRSDSGQYYWFQLRARPLLGGDGTVIRCVGTISDVTDSKNAEERLLHDSVHDNLTGVENRQLFMHRLETVIAMAHGTPGIRPSVFHINIDKFRDLNARLGFGVGDTILLTVARRLSRLLREGDAIARLNGDQFAVLFLSDSQPDKIAVFADSIRKSLNVPIPFAGEELRLTASIGIATWTSEIRRAEDLMRDAELALIQAQKGGGNRIEPFRPAFRVGKDTSAAMLDELRMAVERGQISVQYQPIMRLDDRSIAGFEALVRWQHPKFGQVPPADFVPLAERSGVIGELSRHVLEIAADDFARILESSGDDSLFVSVNISSRELLRHDLVAEIAEILTRTELPPEMLRIELTESLVMENPENSAEVLRRIKGLGVGLSLDDFGTGYSSLAYLMRFPFDTIKIDKSFVHARERKERLVVLRSIIAMAHGLNQQLIAEGIEMESDVAELLQLGCEYGQGYLFGQPVGFDDAERLAVEEYRLAGQ